MKYNVYFIEVYKKGIQVLSIWVLLSSSHCILLCNHHPKQNTTFIPPGTHLLPLLVILTPPQPTQ